jgi:hypothetical protein
MFNCYNHGWTSGIEMCPVCNPVQTWTSSGTDVQKVVSAWVVPETTGVLETNAKPGEWIVPTDLKRIAQKTTQVEDIIKNALLANGYPDDCQTSAEEMASIVLFELQDNNILVRIEE